MATRRNEALTGTTLRRRLMRDRPLFLRRFLAIKEPYYTLMVPLKEPAKEPYYTLIVPVEEPFKGGSPLLRVMSDMCDLCSRGRVMVFGTLEDKSLPAFEALTMIAGESSRFVSK